VLVSKKAIMDGHDFGQESQNMDINVYEQAF